MDRNLLNIESSDSNQLIHCKKCNYKSERYSNLKRHIKTTHQNRSNKNFYCCGIKFQDKGEYRVHSREIHRNGHECWTCGRRFSRRALLRRHSSVHTGFKEFKCTICTYASSHKSNLQRHYKIHGYQPNAQPNLYSIQTHNVTSQLCQEIESVQSSIANSSTKQTINSEIKLKSPILRQMLNTESSFPNSKLKLKHSIESILSCDKGSSFKYSSNSCQSLNRNATSGGTECFFPVQNISNSCEELDIMNTKGIAIKNQCEIASTIETIIPRAIINRTSYNFELSTNWNALYSLRNIQYSQILSSCYNERTSFVSYMDSLERKHPIFNNFYEMNSSISPLLNSYTNFSSSVENRVTSEFPNLI